MSRKLEVYEHLERDHKRITLKRSNKGNAGGVHQVAKKNNSHRGNGGGMGTVNRYEQLGMARRW